MKFTSFLKLIKALVQIIKEDIDEIKEAQKNFTFWQKMFGEDYIGIIPVAILISIVAISIIKIYCFS